MTTELVKWEGFVIKKIVGDNMAVYVNEDILAFLDSIDISGKNVIDGGSNIGIYALVFSYLCGYDGTVYCFEIQKTINDLCKENADINKRKNIVCFNLALSNKIGESVGYTPIDYSKDNISSVGVRTESGGDIKVATSTIDDFGFTNVGLIKLDLEGYEPKALDGAWETIDRDKPYMIIELSPIYLDNKQSETIEKIKYHGYLVEGISDCNYLCTPKSSSYDVSK